jgi:protein tyrosine phosphatase (PTP) superfamily phosphohydrolase (DUF442 family)
MNFKVKVITFLILSILLLYVIFPDCPHAMCQETPHKVNMDVTFTVEKAKPEIEKFIPLIYKSGVTGKAQNSAEFHINRFLKNIGIIKKNDFDFATGLINHKLKMLKNYSNTYKQMQNRENAYTNVFWGSFNIGMLEKGKVYRNSQPSPDDLRWYIKNAGFRTIINLRTETKFWGSFDAKEEEKICKENGAIYKNFRLLDQDDPPPTKKQIEEVLAFIDKAPKPLMFHCAHGKGRTGMVAAAYRVSRQGWKAEDAIKEAVPYGFRPERMPNQVKVIKSFEK